MSSITSEKVLEGDDAYVNTIKKYPLDNEEDMKNIFCFPYLVHDKTAAYIKEYGRIMFIIRGIPHTGKNTLSNMLKKRYPNATYCSAIKQIPRNTYPTDEMIRSSVKFCENKAKAACMGNDNIIIVQNSNMSKIELQHYLNLAAEFDYTVIMAITMYRFDITVEAIEKLPDNKFDSFFLQKRLSQWEDICPMFTGWFVSPQDSPFILDFCLKSVMVLLDEMKFCKHFNVCNKENFINCFPTRKMLSCIAGFSKDTATMKKYYLSDKVQSSYGKYFTITIVGYLITASGIIGIVDIKKRMAHLVFQDGTNVTDNAEKNPVELQNLTCNVSQHGKFTVYPKVDQLRQKTTVCRKNWKDGEDMNISSSSFIHLAQQGFTVFDIYDLKREFDNALQSKANENGIIHDDTFVKFGKADTKICYLPNNVWLIKAPQKILVKTIFTGLYI